MVSIDDCPYEQSDLSHVLTKDKCWVENIYPVAPHPSLPGSTPLETFRGIKPSPHAFDNMYPGEMSLTKMVLNNLVGVLRCVLGP